MKNVVWQKGSPVERRASLFYAENPSRKNDFLGGLAEN
jgi:hypothetical protein